MHAYVNDLKAGQLGVGSTGLLRFVYEQYECGVVGSHVGT